MEIFVRILKVVIRTISMGTFCMKCTWLKKWHSRADLATTREEKTQETRMMVSGKECLGICKKYFLKSLTLGFSDCSIFNEYTIEIIPESDKKSCLEQKLCARLKESNENGGLWCKITKTLCAILVL